MTILDNVIDDNFNFSIINKIELLGFDNLTSDEEVRFTELIDAASIYELHSEIVSQTIEIRKKYKIKLPDAIIAATAISYQLTLITRNTDDFKNIIGLKADNPWLW